MEKKILKNIFWRDMKTKLIGIVINQCGIREDTFFFNGE
jgi:hypothetical protein